MLKSLSTTKTHWLKVDWANSSSPGMIIFAAFFPPFALLFFALKKSQTSSPFQIVSRWSRIWNGVRERQRMMKKATDVFWNWFINRQWIYNTFTTYIQSCDYNHGTSSQQQSKPWLVFWARNVHLFPLPSSSQAFSPLVFLILPPVFPPDSRCLRSSNRARTTCSAHLSDRLVGDTPVFAFPRDSRV